MLLQFEVFLLTNYRDIKQCYPPTCDANSARFLVACAESGRSAQHSTIASTKNSPRLVCITDLLELPGVLVPVLVQLVLLVVVLLVGAHAAVGDGHVLPDVALADPVSPLIVVVAAALILFLKGE